MIPPSGGVTWDYEWYPSDGDLSENGFAVTKTGTSSYATVALTDNYYQFSGTSSSYYNATYQDTYPVGVCEVEVLIPANNGRFVVYLSNGENRLAVRMQYSANYKGIYLGNSWDTKLKTIALNTIYKIKLVSKGKTNDVPYGDIYVDNELVAQDVDMTSWSGDTTILSGRASGSGKAYSYLYSVKMMFNRTA